MHTNTFFISSPILLYLPYSVLPSYFTCFIVSFCLLLFFSLLQLLQFLSLIFSFPFFLVSSFCPLSFLVVSFTVEETPLDLVLPSPPLISRPCKRTMHPLSLSYLAHIHNFSNSLTLHNVLSIFPSHLFTAPHPLAKLSHLIYTTRDLCA